MLYIKKYLARESTVQEQFNFVFEDTVLNDLEVFIIGEVISFCVMWL